MLADKIFATIGRFTVRFRWLIVVLWIVGAAAATSQLPALADATQSNNSKFLPASAPSQHALDLAGALGHSNQESVPVLVAREGEALKPADLEAVTALRTKLAGVRNVAKVVDAGRSEDGHAERLLVYVPIAQAHGEQGITLVDDLRAGLKDTRLPNGLQAHLSGNLALEVDQAKESGSTGDQIEIVSLLFILVLLVFIFRSVTLSLVTLLPSMLAVAISGPLVAEAAKHGLQVSSMAQFLMIVLILGAGTDYGLFLVFRVREELRSRSHDTSGQNFPKTSSVGASAWQDLRRPRRSAEDAVVHSVTKVGESVAASAGTVILAMFTLLLASFSLYSDLGLPFAIAIAVTLLATMTLLPALLSIRLSLLAVKRSLFRVWFGRAKLIPISIQGKGGSGLWGRLSGRIVRYPVATLVIGVVFFGGLSVAVTGYTSGGFGGNTSPPKGSDSAAGQTIMDQHFPQNSANPTSAILVFDKPVWQDPAAVETATDLLSKDKQFTRVAGPLNPVGARLAGADYTRLHDLLGPADKLPPIPPPGTAVPAAQYLQYRATANLISPDGRTALFATDLAAGAPGSTEAMHAVPDLRASVQKVAGAVHAKDSALVGEAPIFYDISDISADDLTKIVPIAILAIGLLLALVLRSLVAPLYLIASVGISYLAALGLAVLVFLKIGGDGGLVFFMPFLMFIFLLALGEDYNILMMTRIREEAHRLPLRDAVVTALRTTGTTITSAGVVLAGSFLVLVLVAGNGSDGDQVRNMGLGLTFGILMDTFLVRTLLVPSTVILLGRWNWWPSKLSRAQVPPFPEPEAAAETEPVPSRV